MTISWGQLGSLWGWQSQEHCHSFCEARTLHLQLYGKAGYFSISWFPKEFRKDLDMLGSKSGRDGDKIAQTRLTPKQLVQAWDMKKLVSPSSAGKYTAKRSKRTYSPRHRNCFLHR